MSQTPPVKRRPSAEMLPVPLRPGGRILLRGVSWREYVRYSAALERAGRRLYPTYDRGTLRLMSPSSRHGSLSASIHRFVMVVTAALRVSIASFGSTTLRSRPKRRGIDPDESFYVQNVALVRGGEELDFERVPFPDLVVEVDQSGDSRKKMGTYAGLGLPELWVAKKGQVSFHVLGADGAYVVVERSRALPMLGPEDLVRWLEARTTMDHPAYCDALTAWARDEVAQRDWEGKGA